MKNDLMTLKEAAAFLRTAESTLRYWRYEGTGPRSAKLGRRVVYRRSDLEAYVQEQFDQEPA